MIISLPICIHVYNHIVTIANRIIDLGTMSYSNILVKIASIHMGTSGAISRFSKYISFLMNFFITFFFIITFYYFFITKLF